jgi:hypothetical protein
VHQSGLKAVELYLDNTWLDRAAEILDSCGSFPLRYAIHAPNDSFRPEELARLALGLRAEIMVFHDIFWDDEWEILKNAFLTLPTKICIENIATMHQPLKFMRRFGMGLCLDLEHLQLEVGGVYKDEFLRLMRMASHVHLTGYSFGSQLWHSHIHQSPVPCSALLNLLEMANYSGMIVSEARVDYQSLDEFSRLFTFSREWKELAS